MRFIQDKLFQAVKEYHAIRTTQRIRRQRRTRTYFLPKQENAKFMRDEYIRMLMYQYAGSVCGGRSGLGGDTAKVGGNSHRGVEGFTALSADRVGVGS